jgi:arylsulfatase A-like enzyme
MTPLFDGELDLSERLLFWEAPYQVWIEYFANRIWAVRRGKWKLMQSHITEPLELYDLENDPAEINNVADKHPQIVKELQQAFKEWFKDVYSDCPYDIQDFIKRLKDKGLVTKESTEEIKEGY